MRIIASICLPALLVAAAGAADSHWPRFRGPGGHGIAPAPDVPSEITAEHVRWSTELPGSGHSSPVVWDDRIFLACDDADGERRCIACIDAATGRIEWTKWMECRDYHIHRDNSFAAATPTVDADAVYVSWVTGDEVEALALDHDGKLLWNRKLGRFKATHGPGASPLLVDDILVVTNDQESPDAAIHGLDRKTGKTVWSVKREPGRPSYGTPVPLRADGRRLVHSSPAHGLTAIDPATGEAAWSVGDLFTMNVVTSPVVCRDIVFATAGRGGRREAVIVRFDDSGARVLSRPERDIPYVPTPIAVDSRLFLWDDRGTATCLEPATGKVVWSERVTGPTYTSPVSDGERIFGISRKGELVVIAASPEFRELGSFQLPEGTHATPAIAHGDLFVRTFNRLLRIGS